MDETVFAFVTVVFSVLWLVHTTVKELGRRRQMNAVTRLHDRLLDKLDSAEQAAAFLQSPASQRMVESLRANPRGAEERTLGAIQAGLVLTLLGVALLGCATASSHHLVPTLRVFGCVTAALGVGFLASAFFHYHLSRRWGLLRNQAVAEAFDREP